MPSQRERRFCVVVAFPNTGPNGETDLDLFIRTKRRVYDSLGRPFPVLYGALAWAFNRPGRY